MTIHIAGTGWHGIEGECNGHCGPRMDCCEAPLDLPVEIAAALKPCPTCNGKSWVHEDRPGGYGIADPCPDCHEGHPTITVTVPCPTCEGRGVTRHHIRDMYASIRYADPCPVCSAGRVERQAVIREVLPIGDVPDSGYPDDSPKRFIYISKADTTRLVDCIEKSDTRIDLPDATNYTHAAHIEVLPCTS